MPSRGSERGRSHEGARAPVRLARQHPARRARAAEARGENQAPAREIRDRPHRQVPRAGGGGFGAVQGAAAPGGHRALLGEALGALRNIQERAPEVRRRGAAREGAGEARTGENAVGVQLAASPGKEGPAGRRGPPRPAARMGRGRRNAQEDPLGQSGRALRLQVMRVAIVGLGMAVTPPAKSLLALSGRVEVAYAFSPSRERREKFGDRFPFPRCDSLETILEDASVGTLALLTPPNTHLELVRRCAEAGKHVLLEKPIETRTARAEQLVETGPRAKGKVGAAF